MNAPEFQQSIGILGGMGPAATIRLNERIVAHAQSTYGAIQDFDYPEMITISLAKSHLDHKGIKPRIDTIELKNVLQKGIQRLERAGATILAMPCNTVHRKELFSDLKLADSSVLVNIVEAVVDEVIDRGIGKVGVIASEDSIKRGVYGGILEQKGIKTINVTSHDQQKVNQVILRAMGGHLTDKDVEAIRHVQRGLSAQGAEGVILGCTELSLLYDDLAADDDVFIDSIEITAQLLLQKAAEGKHHESL